MTTSNNRIHLNEMQVESVAGGNVQIVCYDQYHYCYGSHTPDVKYEFQSKRAVDKFIEENYDYYGEQGIFQAMIDAGIVTPM